MTVDSMREACKVMGRELHTTDRFIVNAIGWLARRDNQNVEIRALLGAGWRVTACGQASADDSLHGALAALIVALDYQYEITRWELASDNDFTNCGDPG